MNEGEQRDRFLVDEMLRHLGVVELTVRGGKVRVEDDVTTRYALEHATELFLEAAKKVSGRFQKTNPGVPWESFVGVRNSIAHPYDIGAAPIALGELWKFASGNAPRIARYLRRAKFPKDADPRRE